MSVFIIPIRSRANVSFCFLYIYTISDTSVWAALQKLYIIAVLAFLTVFSLTIKLLFDERLCLLPAVLTAISYVFYVFRQKMCHASETKQLRFSLMDRNRMLGLSHSHTTVPKTKKGFAFADQTRYPMSLYTSLWHHTPLRI